MRHLVLLLVLAVAPLGCGGHSPPIVVDGFQLPIQPEDGSARVTSNSDGSHITVDFGAVVLGQSPIEYLNFYALGPADLTILKVSYDSGPVHPDWKVDLFEGQTAAGRGAPLPIAIRFAPTTRSDKSMRATVTTDSGMFPTFDFDLRGRGINPGDPVWAQDPYYCGQVPLNTSLAMTLTLYNAATAPLKLVAVPELVDSNVTTQFAWKGGLPPTADSIPAGGSLGLPLVFTPTMAGTFQASVRVLTDDPNNSVLLLPLTCSGEP